MENTLKIIRIEKEGIGIFQTRDPLVYESSTYNRYVDKHQNFPTPEQENLYIKNFDKEWFCGYLSFKEMQKRLSNRDLQFLIKRGFEVFYIEVEKFQKGEFQALFLKESIVKKENITFLFQ